MPAADPRVTELKSLLSDQPDSPLRPDQVRDYQDEHGRLQRILGAPAWQGGDRGEAARRARSISKTLAEQAPKEIADPIKKDRVAQLTMEVMKDVIRPAMLSKTEMRRNPAGAVDIFLRQENSRQCVEAKKVWRRGQRALAPDDDSPNYTNIERYRPEGTIPGTSTFMADAQIPGHFAMSQLAKDNWPEGLGDGPENTPLKVARRRDPLSPEARALANDALARGRANNAAKREMARREREAAIAEVEG